MSMGPPDWIPVIKEAEIPNHELVSPKPIPRIDHTEKVRLSSPCRLEEMTDTPSSRPLFNLASKDMSRKSAEKGSL